MTKHALARRAPVLGNVTVERVYGRDRLLRLRQLVLKILARLSYRGVLALNGLSQRSKLPLVLIDKDKLAPDLGHHVLEGVWVRFAAEDENVVTRLASPLALIELVAVHARRESNVAGGQEEDPVAFAALAEVQGTGALEVRSVSGSDLNTKSASEGATDVSGGVYGEDVVEKPWANGLGEDGLPESDLDVGELSSGEDLLAADGGGLGGLEGERPRIDAHPEIEGTGFPFFLGEADRIDGRPQDFKGIEELVHLFT